jgi:hypothetical protein
LPSSATTSTISDFSSDCFSEAEFFSDDLAGDLESADFAPGLILVLAMADNAKEIKRFPHGSFG